MYLICYCTFKFYMIFQVNPKTKSLVIPNRYKICIFYIICIIYKFYAYVICTPSKHFACLMTRNWPKFPKSLITFILTRLSYPKLCSNLPCLADSNLRTIHLFFANTQQWWSKINNTPLIKCIFLIRPFCNEGPQNFHFGGSYLHIYKEVFR